MNNCAGIALERSRVHVLSCCLWLGTTWLGSVCADQPDSTKHAAVDAAVAKIIAEMGQFEDEDTLKKVAAPLRTMSPEAVSALRRILARTKEDETRWRIVYAFAVLGEKGKDAAPDLVRITKEKPRGTDKYGDAFVHAGLRCLALHTLKEIKLDWAEYIPLLLEAIDDPMLRETAERVLKEIGPAAKRAVPGLLEKAKKSPNRLYTYIAILGQIGPDAREAIPLLIEQLRTNKDEYVRKQIVIALAKISPESPDVAAVLVGALENDKYRYVRKEAAEALGSMKAAAKVALPALQRAVRDDHEVVREAAAKALPEIDPSDRNTTSVLTDVFSGDHNRRVRKAAVSALGLMRGPAAKEAIPALERALQDNDPGVRKAAAESLRRIQKN